MKISISFLSSKFSILETLIKIDNTDASYVHVDIMDGIFTQESFNPINTLKQSLLSKKLDVHLMTNNVIEWIKKLNNLNIEYITFHSEIKENKKEIINYLKSLNIKVGMAINPETKITKIKHYLKDLDLILIMSVNPGKGGQKFMPEILPKIEELNDLKKINNYKYKIEVDGGIEEKNSKILKKLGCNIIVAGSFVCKRTNFQEQINLLK